MAQEQLIRALGVWANGNGPLYRLLAQALQKAISQGDILGGTKLPPERGLALALAVSRSTVVAAYNLLQDEGWVESRQGSGTLVIVRPLPQNQSLYPSDPSLGLLIGEPPGIIDMSTGAIGALSDIVQEEMVKAQPEMLKLLAETGYSPLGLPALRQAIARRYIQAGTPTNENQILVTTGAQQAIWLVANLYVQRDEAVLIENPTYFGALDAFRGVKARLVPLPVGEAGVKPELIRGILASTYPRLIYLMPAFHNPSGKVISTENCRKIVRLAEEFGIPLVEDTTLEDLNLSAETTSGLAYHAREGVVISIGSLSKLFWAGLRVGWLRAPEIVINRLARLKVVNDLGSGLVSQLLAARLLARLDEARSLRQKELSSRLDYLTSLLNQQLPTWIWSRPAGGLFLWVRLPEGDAGEFSQLALRYGVRIAAGEMMSVDQSHTNYLRLSFFLEPQKLEEGVRRLGRAWANYPRLSHAKPGQIEVMV